MESYFWKEDESITCQINVVGIRNFNQIKKLYEKDWDVFGDGFSIKKGEKYTLLMKKDNATKQFMNGWIKDFPGKIFCIKEDEYGDKLVQIKQ